MIVIIDNYDSFTYNLFQYIGEISSDIKVFKNDEITVEELTKLNIDGIVISPGPGRPEDSGISLEVINTFKGVVPILGVCLGHQAIGQLFGGNVVHAGQIMHGKTSLITTNESGVFSNIPKEFKAMRYHSLVVEKDSLPECLEITATSPDGEIMGLKHKDYSIYGVQFHPESIGTSFGKDIVRNFVDIVNDGIGNRNRKEEAI